MPEQDRPEHERKKRESLMLPEESVPSTLNTLNLKHSKHPIP